MLTEQQRDFARQALFRRKEIEVVSPKLEAFRNPSIGGSCPSHIRIKGCRGGRGAGAKSFSLTSLINQRANYENLRIACFREIFGTLEESVYYLIKERAEFLGFKNWQYRDNHIDTPSGSHFIFKGLKDLRASRNIKGLAKFDIFFIEEAATISMESWNMLLPTLVRNENAELWFCYNPEEEVDPVAEKIWNRNRTDSMMIELKPGKEDNPWWNKGLQFEMEEDYKFNPIEAEHIWGGQPRQQGDNAVLSRARIRQAMNRNIKEPVGQISLGVDVARFGDDSTVIYKRKGLKVIERKELRKADTIEVANTVWDMANRDPSIKIKVDDTGVGGGVSDLLRSWHAKVVMINFGSTAEDEDHWGNCATEMWFTLPIDEIDIPDSPELMRQLSGRKYQFDNKGRRIIESKKDYKKRLGRSCDDSDSIILCYYESKTRELPQDIINELASRRNR